jgi:hypothetical protein
MSGPAGGEEDRHLFEREATNGAVNFGSQGDGVSDGLRTRSLLSHSQALYP